MFKKSKMIVFVGCDGVGKTTLIRKLAEEIDDFVDVKYFHIKFNLIPRVGVIIKFLKDRLSFKTKVTSSQSQVKNAPAVVKHNYGPDMPLWKLLVNINFDLLDYFLGYLHIFRSQSSLIIFDRYIYEFFTELNCRRLPLFVMRFYMRLVPKPDFIFHLYNDPDTIYRRKPELSVDEIIEIQSRIDLLLANNENLIKIKTDRSDKELSDMVLRIISTDEKY